MSTTVPPEPVFTVAAVASRLGVAPATLRTWDRRYGLGPSDHVEGSHRRYSNADIARLLVMRRLTLSGVAPADAARIAITTDGEMNDIDGPVRLSLAPSGAERKLSVEEEIALIREGSPGGRNDHANRPVLGVAPAPDTLVEAAERFDALTCVAIIRSTIDRLGAAEGWAHVIAPAFDVIRSENLSGSPGEDAAVMTAAACHAALRDNTPDQSKLEMGLPPILLSGASRGQDQLGAHFFGLALQQAALDHPLSNGRAPRVLIYTHDFAIHSLDGMLANSDARAFVLVAATTPSDHQIVSQYEAAGNDGPLFLVGSGWSPADAGENRHVLRTYAGAVHEVLAQLYSAR